MEMFLLRLIENLCDYLKGYQPPITCLLKKHKNKVWNMCKVNNKDTRTALLGYFFNIKAYNFIKKGLQWQYFGVFIVNLEHVS